MYRLNRDIAHRRFKKKTSYYHLDNIINHLINGLVARPQTWTCNAEGRPKLEFNCLSDHSVNIDYYLFDGTYSPMLKSRPYLYQHISLLPVRNSMY